MDTKICSVCKIEKSILEFNKTSRKEQKPTWVKSLYRYDCKECQVARQKRYAAIPENKLRIRGVQKKYFKSVKGLAVLLYISSKSRAKEKQLDFDLDVDWFIKHITPMKCEATGMQLEMEIDITTHHTYNRPSIDRIDSFKGYTKDNCQIVSVIYNKAKSDGSHNHVLLMAKAMMKSGLLYEEDLFFRDFNGELFTCVP